MNYVDPSGHRNLVILFGYKITKDTHYNRNIKNVNLPKYEHVAKKWKWVKLAAKYSACHQFHRGKYPNAKYLSKDGRREAVFKGTKNGLKGKLITNDEDMGTYNFGVGTGLKHAALDVVPYMLWGNTPKDKTNMAQRIWTSSKELRKDVWEKVKKATANWFK